MKIDHISISRESLYYECPQKYKFRYHLQIVSDVPTPFYFTFGKIVHRIIEEHTNCRGEKTINRIKSELLSGLIDLEPGKKCSPLDNEGHLRLTKHLNNYLKLADKIGYDGETEWEFYEDIDPPNKRMLKGFIDRLIVKNGNVFIIDYKTTKPSKWRKDSLTIVKDLQLACYCWVVNKRLGIPANQIKAALYYLEDAKLVPVRYSDKTLSNVPQRLARVYKEIETQDPNKVYGRVGDHCRNCDYRKICPFYSLV